MQKTYFSIGSASLACLFLVGTMLLHTSSLSAQQILLDNPVKAGALTLFPRLNDASSFYYVPDKARLAVDESGKPRFSFLRYVENVKSDESQSEGEGGGIVHAVVSLGVSEELLDDARRELRRIKPGANIVGPVIYRSGKFGLISAFTDTEGNFTKQFVGFGNAPVMDGGMAAVSIQLTKLGAKVLWESFQTATPDISFSFEMEMGGYRAPHRAVIEADFDQIYEHEAFGAAMATTFFAGEIRNAFEDLYRSGAIKLTQVGDDEQLEALITTAYNKISDIMFAPLNGSGAPGPADMASLNGSKSLLDRATEMLANNRKEAIDINKEVREDNFDLWALTAQVDQPQSNQPPVQQTPKVPKSRPVASWYDRPSTNGPTHIYSIKPEEIGINPREEVELPEYALLASYEMKKIRQRGVFRIDLNKFITDNLTLRFDENIGNLSAYLDNEEIFRQVNLDDPLYRQREIVAFLDGMNASDFGQFINYVDVRVEKKHQNGETTVDEVRIDRNNFNTSGNLFKLLYGWKGDSNRTAWRDYQVSKSWRFFGGVEVNEPLETSSYATINLTPPYQRYLVDIHADPANLKRKKVRAIVIELYYQMGEQEKVKRVNLQPFSDQLSEQVELILPTHNPSYEYQITWRLSGGKTKSSGRIQTSDNLLFADEL